MGGPWGRWGRAVLDLVFPRVCGVCHRDSGEGEGAICEACIAGFPAWSGRECRVCGVPLPDGGARCRACRRSRRAFRMCRSAGLYEGPLRQAVLALKYAGREALAEPLGDFLAASWNRRAELHTAEIVVPVPLHFLKRHARGFNQSERLAAVFSRRVGLPLAAGALSRQRWTRAQAGLDRDRRVGNVGGAFRVRRGAAVEGRRVLLVDDVATTGSTIDACARALKLGGAARVDAWVLVRDV